MKQVKRQKITVTVRLTEEEYLLLRRLCDLKKTSCTGYLAHLATRQAEKELLRYAVEEYTAGRESVSALAKKTGLDVPTILDEVARVTEEDSGAIEGFLSAVKTLAKTNDDPEFYHLAEKALKST